MLIDKVESEALLDSLSKLIAQTILGESESVSHSVMSDSLRPYERVHGILQARKLEWEAIPFFRGSSQPRDRSQVSCIARRFLIS